MSHFTTIKTQMQDREALAAALRDVFPGAIVDVADSLTITGYRMQKVDGEVAVRGVGAYRTDIGFARNPDGTLSRIMDAYTARQRAEQLGRIPQRYSYHSTVQQARRLGFAVTNEQAIAAPAVQRVGG